MTLDYNYRVALDYKGDPIFFATLDKPSPSLARIAMNLQNLHCIDLDQPKLEGFRKFMSAWLYLSEELCFVVDPGPLSSMPHLLAEIRRFGATRIDYILLTHIHIDHAGGTGALVREFPEAQVICHPEGTRHMVAPEKLWQGSLKVLGPMAEAYGEIVPVPAENIHFAENLGDSGIRVFETPGHAQHHLCILFEDLLFAGEVAGVRSEVAEGIYMRPATPPRFMLEVALDSIDRMIALAPRYLVIAHYGLVEPALQYLRIGRKQFTLWVRGVAETLSVPEAEREQALFEWLQQHDENYRNITQLPPDIFARERYFLGNTRRGMQEYVEGLTEEERREIVSMRHPQMTPYPI